MCSCVSAGMLSSSLPWTSARKSQSEHGVRDISCPLSILTLPPPPMTRHQPPPHTANHHHHSCGGAFCTTVGGGVLRMCCNSSILTPPQSPTTRHQPPPHTSSPAMPSMHKDSQRRLWKRGKDMYRQMELAVANRCNSSGYDKATIFLPGRVGGRFMKLTG